MKFDPLLDDALNAALTTNGKLLVATDFDGVLAPLVDDPTRSRPLPRSVKALENIGASDSQKIALAYVSGRKIAELYALAHPPVGAFLFGTHGAETGYVNESGQLESRSVTLDQSQLETLETAYEYAMRLSASADGSWVERKDSSTVLHTRLASDRNRERIEGDFRAYAATLDAHVIPGSNVTEVSVTDASKGESVASLREQIQATTVLYLGDDVTDETVFDTLLPHDIGIKVGIGSTAARFRIENPAQVAYLLERIADKVNPDL